MIIRDFVANAKKGNIDLVEHTHKAVEEAQKISKEYRYITAWADTISRAEELQKQATTGNAQGKLFGVIISVKDNICVKGVESTAGSAILKGYKPLFNATVIEKCLAEGAIILGKTAQDEFGFGGFSVNTGIGYEKPLNPLDKKRTTGGSSGGAAGSDSLQLTDVSRAMDLSITQIRLTKLAPWHSMSKTQHCFFNLFLARMSKIAPAQVFLYHLTKFPEQSRVCV